MDSFYLTLISNNNYDPDNTSSSFRTILPYTLILEKEWQCALTEISFIKSWNNVDLIPDEKDGFLLQTSVIMYDQNALDSFSFNISEGHYEKIDDLLQSINNGFDEYMTNKFIKLKEDIYELEETLDNFKGEQR